jgi:hypothetical protein
MIQKTIIATGAIFGALFPGAPKSANGMKMTAKMMVKHAMKESGVQAFVNGLGKAATNVFEHKKVLSGVLETSITSGLLSGGSAFSKCVAHNRYLKADDVMCIA